MLYFLKGHPGMRGEKGDKGDSGCDGESVRYIKIYSLHVTFFIIWF